MTHRIKLCGIVIKVVICMRNEMRNVLLRMFSVINVPCVILFMNNPIYSFPFSH